MRHEIEGRICDIILVDHGLRLLYASFQEDGNPDVIGKLLCRASGARAGDRFRAVGEWRSDRMEGREVSAFMASDVRVMS